MYVYGEHDADTLRDMGRVAETAYDAAIMADGHVGYVMPIGGVAAYENKVSPIGVGVDIACGNAAVKLDIPVTKIQPYLEELADEIANTIGFGMGAPTNTAPDAPKDHPLFGDDRWNAVPVQCRGNLQARARAQLGTVGGGNHFVDVFSDEEGSVWVGCHFGSRGLGFIIANGMILEAQGGRWRALNPKADWGRQILLSLNDDIIGLDYWDLMHLAGLYAYAGRDWVVEKVARILGGEIVARVHNNHNFAWEEEHDGKKLIVVRKGSTPAHTRSFIGGTMGNESVIMGALPYNRKTLDSTVHGSGRVMGRMQAKGKVEEGRVRPARPHLPRGDARCAWPGCASWW